MVEKIENLWYNIVKDDIMLHKRCGGCGRCSGSSGFITLCSDFKLLRYKFMAENLNEKERGVRTDTDVRNENIRDKRLTFHEIIRRSFSIAEDSASPEEVRTRITSGGQVTGTNALLLFFAIIIACIGLNTNSTAVIIGAMLVSPIMGTLLSLAYGTVTGDSNIVKRSLWGVTVQVVISVLTATLIFTISPVKTVTPELAARTEPSLFDVALAFTGGLAGIIGNTRKEKSNNVIPGIAIATALMPPLCTAGFSLANRHWEMFAGSMYLFLINSYFIFTAAEIVLAVMKMPKRYTPTRRKRKKVKRRKVILTILIVIPAVLMTGVVYNH